MKNSLISLIQKKICTAPVVQTVPYQNEQCSVFHSVTLLTEPIYFSCEEKFYKYWFWMMTRLYFKKREASLTFIEQNNNCLICRNIRILAGLIVLA